MKLLYGSMGRQGMVALSALGALWVLSRAFTVNGAERLIPLLPGDQLVGVRREQLYVLRRGSAPVAPPAAPSDGKSPPISGSAGAPGAGETGSAGSPNAQRRTPNAERRTPNPAPVLAQSIVTVPIRGGTPRTLATVPQNEPLQPTLSGDCVLYARIQAAELEARTVTGPHGQTETVTVLRRPGRTRIIEAPLDGRPARTLPVEIPSDRVTILGRRCFWIRGEPDREELTRAGGYAWQRRIPRSELMETPLDGGPDRRVASPVSWYATFQTRGDTLFWLTDPEGSTGRRDLYFHRAGREGSGVLRDYPSLQAPQVCGERFYWMDGASFLPLAGPSRPSSRRGLMTSLPDGSDRRMVLALSRRRDRLVPAQLLAAQGGYLYCLCMRRPRFRSPGDSVFAPLLCRIDPRRPDAVQQLHNLPAESYTGLFSSDHCYTVVTEHPENWLDWSPSGLARQSVRVLYRYRLPDDGGPAAEPGLADPK